jgi:hypothetical protein
VARKLETLEELFSADLFVAELLCTLRREGRDFAEAESLLRSLSLVFPDKSLATEW